MSALIGPYLWSIAIFNASAGSRSLRAKTAPSILAISLWYGHSCGAASNSVSNFQLPTKSSLYMSHEETYSVTQKRHRLREQIAAFSQQWTISPFLRPGMWTWGVDCWRHSFTGDMRAYNTSYVYDDTGWMSKSGVKGLHVSPPFSGV